MFADLSLGLECNLLPNAACQTDHHPVTRSDLVHDQAVDPDGVGGSDVDGLAELCAVTDRGVRTDHSALPDFDMFADHHVLADVCGASDVGRSADQGGYGYGDPATVVVDVLSAGTFRSTSSESQSNCLSNRKRGGMAIL